MSSPHLKAIIFDIGGVVLGSPFIAIAEYESEKALPKDYLNVSITSRGLDGAMQKFERGELSLFSFYEDFSRELSDTENGNKWYMEYCARKRIGCPSLPVKLEVDGREHITDHPSPASLTAVQHPMQVPDTELRFLGWQDKATFHLRALFDDFCDSSELGMRNGIRPGEAVFLDDIGMNLKAARGLGMETIHVPIGGTLDAVKQLEGKLGIDLTSDHYDSSTPAKL
ncbi:hypothetical protein AZE42_04812 [Rhizopogon vesiculosus]|uniref:Uncharacterized protein n=1 Tax=Rhizopogon vesiculosus TaxID=180088 RepID=A0A1J8Q9S8_9AGAM|nr:hypothetical protein AZE42_04812 [Rhizopogon vesiculosus]